MKPFAKDLHRKGRLDHINEMEQLGKKLIGKNDMGLAYVTEGYEGYDAFCLIANRPELVKYEGFVVYNEKKQLPEYLPNVE